MFKPCLLFFIFLVVFPRMIFSQPTSYTDTIVDTYTYKGVRLQDFYGKKVKRLIGEINKRGDSISFSLMLDEPRGMMIGVILYLNDSNSYLSVYFKDKTIYGVPKGKKAYMDKKIRRQKIYCYHVDYRERGVIRVGPKSEWKE